MPASRTPSNVRTIEHYRRLLRRRAQALQNHVSADLREQREVETHDAGDVADEATRLLLSDLRTGRTEAQAARLREIEEADARLSRGTFGLCEDCGEPIDPQRLELLPEARRCAAHQAEVERATRPPGPLTL